jgi:hypothetical protein
MMARGDANARIVGAWHTPANALRGKTGLLVVYFTEVGTAHAGDLRKPWRVPEGVVLGRAEALVDAIVASATDAKPAPPPALPTTAAPLPIDPADLKRAQDRRMIYSWADKALAEAFERLIHGPQFARLQLSAWEFQFARDASDVFERYGGFTWKQRKCLREIAEKIVAP